MPAYSPNVGRFWSALIDGDSVVESPSFTLRINSELRPERRVVIASYATGEVRAAVAPDVARAIGSWKGIDTAEALRARVADLGIALAAPERVHYLSLGARDELLRAPHHPRVRRLTAADSDAFAAFHAACSADDRDEAFVELDHWAVFGVVDAGRILAVSSAYPWREGPVADIGVLTVPEARHRGHARAVTRAIAAHIIGERYEPQYRCDPANSGSAAVAASSGFTRVLTWQTVEEE